jgi:DNA adenine methylase
MAVSKKKTGTKTVKRTEKVTSAEKRKKINVPFGYFGSKNKIALQLCSNLPPHSCWVEAFCGSAALTLRKEVAPIEIINDIDGEIINLFRQLRNRPKALCNKIDLTPYSEEELTEARINEKNLSKLEKARRFLVQSMMAVNGVFGEERGGFSYSDSYSRNGHDARVNRWINLPDRVQPVVDRLKKVRIEHKDARKLIERFLYRPATLLYLDPPYFTKRTNGYNREANDKKFHEELLTLVKKARCMIFISGYNNALYNRMLRFKSGWKKRSIHTLTKDATGQTHDRVEVIWTNKYFRKALASNKLPITLTKAEIKENKVNPERLPVKRKTKKKKSVSKKPGNQTTDVGKVISRKLIKKKK